MIHKVHENISTETFNPINELEKLCLTCKILYISYYKTFPITESDKHYLKTLEVLNSWDKCSTVSLFQSTQGEVVQKKVFLDKTAQLLLLLFEEPESIQ